MKEEYSDPVRYRVFVKRPDKGYRDTWLWLPKSKISEKTLKNSLEYTYSTGKTDQVLRMWKEEPHHLLVPREFIDISTLDYEVIDLVPEFPKVELTSSVQLDALHPERNAQQKAFDDLVNARGGVLNLACGAGKTVLFLHAAAHWGEPLLIINDKEHILVQWREEIERHLGIPPEDVGWIQGKPAKWDWKRPVVLGMLKSLANYADQLPEGMTGWFGRIVWDEIHHLSAPTFSRTAPLFPGRRYGATATVNRPDGTEVLYHSHVGPVLHKNLDQDIIPSVLFKRSHTTIDLTDREVHKQCYSITGEVHHRKFAAYVGTRPEELDLCSEVIQRGLDQGRRILALSLSRDQTMAMHERFPESSMVIHGHPKKPQERLEVIRSHQLVFATTDLAREALNETRLDSLVLLNEFSDENLLQQAVGRIQRQLLEGTKLPPKVVIIFHVRVPPMRSMGANLKKHFRRWGFETETIG